MAKFSTVVSGTFVRAVEGRDSFGYPVGEPSAEKGPSRLRVHKKCIIVWQMSRLSQVSRKGKGWAQLMFSSHGREGDWRRHSVQGLVLEEKAFFRRDGDSIVVKGDTLSGACS